MQFNCMTKSRGVGTTCTCTVPSSERFCQVVHGLPYALQFSTFSLVLFFLIHVTYGHRWMQKVRLFEPKAQEGAMRITPRQPTYGTSMGHGPHSMYGDVDFHQAYSHDTDDTDASGGMCPQLFLFRNSRCHQCSGMRGS